MKLLKSLLLGSAAGLAAVSGASAADLGAKKPSPVEFVRSCYNPLWGTSGGFVIPGTQTCLRVFGQARFDYQAQTTFQRTTAPSGFRGGATIGLDAITPSEYGNVRAFAAVSTTFRSGNQRTGSGTRTGTFIDGPYGSGIPGAAGLTGGGTEILVTGFIQFAGITAGRTTSFFDPFFTPEVIGTTFRSAPGNVNLIAYTAVLGSGLTASVSIEDPTTRRQAFVSSAISTAAAATGALTNTNITQGGIAMPHVVANLRLDQAWGSAMVAGVLTNVRAAQALAPTVLPAGTFASIPDTKYGFAVQGALKINLPMIAAGDNLVITGAYGEGALSYITSNQFSAATSGQGIGGAGFVTGDAVFDPITGSTKLIKAWSVAAGFQHFWAPTLSSTLFGSYAQIDVPGAKPLDARNYVRDGNFLTVGLNTIWQPVRGLNVALEGTYTKVDPSGRVIDINKNALFNGNLATAGGGCTAATFNAGAVGCFTKSSDSIAQLRLRITRDF
jgi:Porin subfamily